MTLGIGGKTCQQALSDLENMTTDVEPVPRSEFRMRLTKLQRLLQYNQAQAAYLHAGTNLYYFTGLRWSPSERMVAAIVPAEGPIRYVAPRFELDTLRDYWQLEAPISAWEEHENPYHLVHAFLREQRDVKPGKVLIDPATPYFVFSGLRHACAEHEFECAQPLTQACRSIKSATEIALLQRAHEMTLEVQRAVASMLRPGITSEEVIQFIDDAHRRVGAAAGSYFCIVLFGVATSFPHGVKDSQILRENDWVLIDTGCQLQGYNSDITRSYCFGQPTAKQRSAWGHEKAAQLAGFAAATIGATCEACDAAARASLVANGYGPDYALPGLPHRTGHGCGLDIHESPNLVRGEQTRLEAGMVFSCEPMLVLPGELGVRLEDHFYMTESGPVWFTPPSKSIDDPFGT